VREQWTERQRVGGVWQRQTQEQPWLWVVAGELRGDDGAVVRDLGPQGWKIENPAFGELTQPWHWTHCAPHAPVAVVALLWIKIIAFTRFRAWALLVGKGVRLGRATFLEARKQLDRSLLCGRPLPFFSGGSRAHRPDPPAGRHRPAGENSVAAPEGGVLSKTRSAERSVRRPVARRKNPGPAPSRNRN